MKILFLNTWNGRQPDFKDYIASQIPSTDVFCFQEAYAEMKDMCSQMFSGYETFCASKKIEDDDFTNVTYVKKGLKVPNWHPVLENLESTGLGLYTEVESNGNRLNLVNFHGRAYPGDKLDTPLRVAQSKGLLEFLGKLDGDKIIGGDFNLDIDSQSVRMFEEAGYRDLIKEYGIKSTRNEIIWKKYPDTPQYYSDYVFISPEVKVDEFSVPKDIVSDHQPMRLGIERY